MSGDVDLDAPDPLEQWRHELADVEAFLEEEQIEPGRRAAAEQRRAELEGWISAAMNPNRAVAGEVLEQSSEVDAELYRPTGQQLVVSSSGEDLWQVLDAHDEDMILQEFQRRALKVMLYQFKQGGQEIVDLSYQGVNEGVRLMNATGKVRVKIDPAVVEVRREVVEGVEYVVVRTYATDEVTRYGQFGVSMEPRWMKINADTAKKQRANGNPVREEIIDGTTVYRQFDIFAETKALNKSQRNALKVMIPERMRQAMIAMAKGNEQALKTIRAGVGAEAAAELPPPVQTERSAELNAAIRETYQEIRVISVLAYPPGRFGADHRRVQHDEALLETFHGELVARLEHMRSQQG